MYLCINEQIQKKNEVEQWGLIHGLVKKLLYVIFHAEVF